MARRPVPPTPALILPEDSVGKRLEGKKIIVTGTTKGVGVAAQELLAAHGAHVCGCGRTPGKAAEYARKLKLKGYKADGFDCDLGDYNSAKSWVDQCAETMGGIDVVINNASFPAMFMFEEMTPEAWEQGIRNELDLVYNVCHAAWLYLKEAGGASIVNTSSDNGLMGTANTPQTCHAAAKAGVIGLTRQLAAEGGAHGIRANTICPGLIWTEAMQNIPEVMADYLINSQITAQPLEPLDIAYSYLFLASDESRFITAATIPVDGGTAGAQPGPQFD